MGFYSHLFIYLFILIILNYFYSHWDLNGILFLNSQHQNFKKVLRTHLADGDFYSIEEALDGKWVMQPVELLL